MRSGGTSSGAGGQRAARSRFRHRHHGIVSRGQPGDLYVAIRGGRAHGAQFAAEAVAVGAAAVLTDAEGAELAGAVGVPVLVVDCPRAVLGRASALVYGNPAEAITLIGVTGTQGKTTTTQLVAAGAAGAGRRTAVVGTMGTVIDGRAGRQPVDDARGARPARALRGHARARRRRLRHGGLQPRHRDGQGRRSRLRPCRVHQPRPGPPRLPSRHRGLLRGQGTTVHPRACSPCAGQRRRRVRAAIARSRGITDQPFSTSGRDAGRMGRYDVAASSPETSAFVLTSPDRTTTRCSVAMPGGSTSRTRSPQSLPRHRRRRPRRRRRRSRGRRSGTRADAAGRRRATVLGGRRLRAQTRRADRRDAALRPVTARPLILVIGAGGDRDRGKRPIMGEIAARLADLVVVTDDNPRDEDPAAIRAAILAGTAGRGTGRRGRAVVGDRRSRSSQALRHSPRSRRHGADRREGP